MTSNQQQSIDGLMNKLMECFPDDLGTLKEDIRTNARARLDALLRDMQLVSREEYDIQVKMLKRTRALVDELSAKVAKLESEIRVKD